MIFGAIDIGTNAARLLIGEIIQDRKKSFVKKISYTRIPLRLGDDVFDTGKISKHKLEAFVKTIKAFGLITEIFEVSKLRAVSTSAMREAKNAEKVIQKIKKETGIDLEIISGQEEAELIFGAFDLLNLPVDVPFLVIDVGGGSTEISVFEKGNRVASRSFDVGTIRMLKSKVNKNVWTEIKQWIQLYVDLSDEHQIFGTGGNINKVHKLLSEHDADSISLKDMRDLSDKLTFLSIEERMSEYKLKPDRADVIVPALEIYTYVLNELSAEKISVPKMGLSDGIIYDFYKKEIYNEHVG
ncbi:MAG: exopolyphosphatase [Bacteroidetes bacterium]|nr:exopolyphosphatase [Bacteroidota bacterium]